MPLRVLIYGLNYAPEFLGVGKYTTELAEWLVAQGHQVRVICAPPYYPAWQVSASYRAWRYRREFLNGVEVWRCPLWVPKRPQRINRILHLLSFAMSSAIPLLRSVAWKPDCALLVVPSVVCAPATVLFRYLAGCKSWVHVQDFEIDAAAGLGITRRGFVSRLLARLEGYLYRHFDRASSISGRMLQRLVEKGMPRERIFALPNWVDCTVVHPNHAAAPLRRRLGLADQDFVILFAGTLNYKHNIEVAIEAARLLQGRTGLRLLICGAGSEGPRLRFIARHLNNILWLEPLPAEEFPALLCLADVHLVPQRQGAADLVQPSKLGGMLASGRPVIATVIPGTEIAELLSERGIVVPPSDPQALAEAVLFLVRDEVTRKRLGAQGRRYAEDNLDKSAVLARFQDELMQLIHEKG